MRLIDADRVVITYTDHKGLESDFSKGVEFAMDVYDSQPTVEAIPVEWIKKKLLSCQYEYENDYDRGFDKGWNCVIKTLLKDWEKENDTI